MAVGCKNLSKPNFDKIVPILLEDIDLGVRKVTLKSLPKNISTRIKDQIKKMALSDSSDSVQKIAEEVLEKMN